MLEFVYRAWGARGGGGGGGGGGRGGGDGSEVKRGD